MKGLHSGKSSFFEQTLYKPQKLWYNTNAKQI